MEEVQEEVQKVPEKLQEVPEKVQEVPEKKKKSKVIEAPIAEEQPNVAIPEPKEPKPKRTGRPPGTKDSKPRQKKTVTLQQIPEDTEPAEPRAESRRAESKPEPRRDPVQDYLETKRLALERAYQSQGENWSNLLSHLM